MSIKIDDEVWTKAAKSGIPAGTFGIVSEIDGDDIWVDVYIPSDADVPEDTVRYREDELDVQ